MTYSQIEASATAGMAAPALHPLFGIRLVVVSNYYEPELTGSAPPISDLCRWLAQNGAKVTTLTQRPNYPERVVFPAYRHGKRDNEILGDVEVKRVPTLVIASSGVMARALAELSFALQVYRAFLFSHVQRSDTLIAVCPSIFSVAVSGSQSRSAAVAIVHDIQSGLAGALSFRGSAPLLRVLRAIERKSLNRFKTIITLSAKMRENLIELGVTRPIMILPPQVDIAEFQQCTTKSTPPYNIAYSGNFGRKQGLEQIILFARELERRNFPVSITLRGNGSEFKRIQTLVEAAKVGNIRLEGLVSREELPHKMCEADIHLVLQDGAGADYAVPSKVFTIMAAGRPFIGTATSSSPLGMLATSTGAGICVPPEDADDLADAVIDLLSSPERRAAMARAGRNYVERNVDRNIVCAEIARFALAVNS